MKGTNDDTIKVFVRVRPMNLKEANTTSCIENQTSTTIKLKQREKQKETQQFAFDNVFGPDSTQEDVYDKVGKEAVNSAFEGFNGTIFAYGQTSSGKTHTCIGPDYTDKQKRGILPRLVEQLFNKISEAPSCIQFRIKISSVEIYMEKIKDLLDVSKTDLKIRQSKTKGIYIQDVTEEYVSSTEQTISIIKKGISNRTVGQTNMNDVSSRSHMVFIITLYQNDLKDLSAKSGKIILVDLAGSEKISRTGAQGKLLDQAKQINKSLSALGNVINALTEQKVSHVPYRDSKLTRILQQSLGGNSKTNLIINVSPSVINHNQTLSSLRFGLRAKQIKNKPKINKQYTVAELLLLLEKAQKKNIELEQIIRQLTASKRKSTKQSIFAQNLLDSDNPIVLSQAEEVEVQVPKYRVSKISSVLKYETQYQSDEESEEEKKQKNKKQTDSPEKIINQTYDEKLLLCEQIESLNQQKTAIYRQYEIVKDKYQILLKQAKFSHSKINSQKRQNQKLIQKITSEQMINQQKTQKIINLTNIIEKYEESLNILSSLTKNSSSAKGFGNVFSEELNKVIFDALSIRDQNANYYENVLKQEKKEEKANKSQEQIKEMRIKIRSLEEEISMFKHLQEAKEAFVKQKIQISNERLRMHQDLENRIQKVLQLEQKLDEEIDKRKFLQQIVDADESQKGRKIISLQRHLAELSESYYVLKGQQSSWMTNSKKTQEKVGQRNKKILELQKQIMGLKEELQIAKIQIQEQNDNIIDNQLDLSDEEIKKQATIVKVLKSSSIRIN